MGEPNKIFEIMKRIPEIDINDRGKMYTGECVCGGTIRAMRVEYNGHLRAGCDRCGFRLIQ